jgi:hypothetical protein
MKKLFREEAEAADKENNGKADPVELLQANGNEAMGKSAVHQSLSKGDAEADDQKENGATEAKNLADE